MIKINKINKSYKSKTILKNISFVISDNQKVALVGSNGSGKSTLLKIIAGIEEPDSGFVQLPKNCRIGYLPQEANFNKKETIAEYFNRDGADIADYRAEAILDSFGLKNIDFSRQLSSLSGGQKSKIALAGILLKGFDVLLLDEPTNNLDLPALIWLEQYLKDSNASCFIVSHDRKFLDNIVSRVLEIDKNKREITSYTGSYSDYLNFKEKELQRKTEEYLLQQEEIERLESAIVKNKNWANKGARQGSSDNDKRSRGYNRERSVKSANRAKTIEKRLEKIDKIDAPKQKIPLAIPLEAMDSAAKHFISLKDVFVKYPSGFNLGPISMEVSYGTRAAILGENGTGKSSIIKMIAGSLSPLSGAIEIGPSLVIGNLMQEHENMPREKSLIEFLQEKSGANKQTAYYLLTKFGFDADEADKKIKELSPGGRARLLLALFCAKSVNVLLLDEPTNHLDVEAVNALENLLETYTGTVILVSHDRYFLEKINPNYIFAIENGELAPIPDIYHYINAITKLAKRMIRIIK